MKYMLTLSVEDSRYTDSIYYTEKHYDNLSDAEAVYNQFNGIEVFDGEANFEGDMKIIYAVTIYEITEDEDIEFIKEKYKTVDLKDYHKDFWSIFNKLDK